MNTIRVDLYLVPLRPDPDGDLEAACPACGGAMDVHQRDQMEPGRLLDTCGSCASWYLIHPAAALMVLLP